MNLQGSAEEIQRKSHTALGCFVLQSAPLLRRAAAAGPGASAWSETALASNGADAALGPGTATCAGCSANGCRPPASPQPFAGSAGGYSQWCVCLWDAVLAGTSLQSLWLNSRYFAFSTGTSRAFNRDAQAG